MTVRPRELQPMLHHLVSSVAAPALVLSERDGQLRGDGVCGWYVDDVRLLSQVELSIDGSPLDLVSAASSGARDTRFGYVARGLGDLQPDPTVFVDRARRLTPSRLIEELEISSTATAPVEVVVRVGLGSDLASMSQVRQGAPPDPAAAQLVDAALVWSRGGVGARVTVSPLPQRHEGAGMLVWTARLERGDALRIRIEAEPWPARAPAFEYGGPATWAAVQATAADRRLERLLGQGAADLEGLLLRDGSTGDRFIAAGSPWFLTLFGRDSLWAARMMLPLGADLAMSTLRALARRQGVRDDARTEEAAGKILHELRANPVEAGDLSLPPLYYGTVDATTLFVVTLADAWRWGADPAQVAVLLPAARRCLGWAMEQSEASGWLQYIDTSGRGLANQGWKDSNDSVQFADGRLAEAPIALSEVQAYAYQAAIEGARLLDAFGLPEVDGLAGWAADLRERFHRHFWVSDRNGDYPAIALDRDGARVDSRASNMGHLLGTGLLDRDQAAAVAAALASPDLDSGFGLRTLTAASPRFSRLSYHGGTVWPHDTAIAAMGLSAEGFRQQAAALALGLVRAGEAFDYRLPELYGGDSLAGVARPSAYPAACRPQAWAAAAPLAALMAVSGVRVDLPQRTVRHPAYTSASLGAVALSGLRIGSERLDVSIAADGRVTVSTGADVEIVTQPEHPADAR